MRHASAENFVCTEFAQPPNLCIPGHAHPSPILLFVLSGSVTENFGSRRHEFEPASVVIKPSAEIHEHRYGSHGVHCIAVEIGGPVVSEDDRIRKLCNDFVHLREMSLFVDGLNLRRLMHNDNSASEICLEECITVALGRLIKDESRETSLLPPPWLRKAHEMVRDQCLEKLSLARIAREAGVHPVYLADTFRKYYGATIGKTIRRFRLEHALGKVVRSNESLTGIALDSGFFDHSHFTGFVKEQTGLTPSGIRAMTHNRDRST